MLRVESKLYMLSVVMLSVIMLNVVAPHLDFAHYLYARVQMEISKALYYKTVYSSKLITSLMRDENRLG
jgi:hypothetical protein